jgi:hypothetical protein
LVAAIQSLGPYSIMLPGKSQQAGERRLSSANGAGKEKSTAVRCSSPKVTWAYHIFGDTRSSRQEYRGGAQSGSTSGVGAPCVNRFGISSRIWILSPTDGAACVSLTATAATAICRVSVRQRITPVFTGFCHAIAPG